MFRTTRRVHAQDAVAEPTQCLVPADVRRTAPAMSFTVNLHDEPHRKTGVKKLGEAERPPGLSSGATSRESERRRCNVHRGCGRWAVGRGMWDVAKQALDCNRVVEVTGHPDACESDVATTPCEPFAVPAGLPLPASRRSIFQ
jgi:hypothetical protein